MAKGRTTTPRNEPRRGSSDNELLVYGDIGESWWGDYVLPADVAAFLRDFKDGDEVVIRINSFGGSAIDGVAIYSLLRDHPARVLVKVDGSAISAASIIAMAGDEILMGSSALMMIHDPWTWAAGNSAELRETADTLDVVAEALSKAYAKKTGKTEDECRALMSAETWMSADKAVEEGFATGVMGASDDDDEEDAQASLPCHYANRYRNVPDGLRLSPRATQAVAIATNHHQPGNAPAPPQHEEPSMKLIMKALGLREDASEQAAVEAIDNIKAKVQEKEAIEAQNAKLVEERDAATARAAKLHEKQVRAEVEALVGKKIHGHEVEAQVELALANRELFDKLISQRADMTVLNRDPAGIGENPKPEALKSSNHDEQADDAKIVDFITQASGL